jgi:hypothetical protein
LGLSNKYHNFRRQKRATITRERVEVIAITGGSTIAPPNVETRIGDSRKSFTPSGAATAAWCALCSVAWLDFLRFLQERSPAYTRLSKALENRIDLELKRLGI